MTEQSLNLGFKKLTKENWNLPDPINEYFIKLNLYTGEKISVSSDERVEEFLKIEVSTELPIDVYRQFEAARGAMLYGCFFYPLFALGADQLLRVAESAVTHRCLDLSLTKRDAKYEIKLKKLKEFNHLTAEEYDEWEILRKMRNISSHSQIQPLFPSFEAISVLKNIADKINKLFQKS